MIDEPQGKIEIALSERIVYVRVCGLGTMHNCMRLSEFCNAMLAGEYDRAVFDLKECTGMDSTFMGVLAGLAIRFHARPSPVVVINADSHCRKLISGIGLDCIVQVCDDPIDIPKIEMCLLNEEPHELADRLEFIRRAHENLVEIDKRNRERFGHFLEILSRELGRPKPIPPWGQPEPQPST